MARLSRVCLAPSGRRTWGGPFTQGGARRLRRLALPWANLFCPFGAWGGLNAARFRRGMAVLPGMAARSEPGPRGATVHTPRRGNYKIAQGRASRLRRDAPPWGARPHRRSIAPKGHDKTANRTCSRSLRNGCNWMASNRGPRRAKRMAMNGLRSVSFRHLGHFDERFMALVSHFSRICFAPSGRRTWGGPFTQGGAQRLRRLALPWANLFCPFGAWGGLNAARFRRGMAVLLGMAVCSVPGRRDPIVLTPRRGNDKIAQGRASRRSRDAPPWVARPPQVPSPRRGNDKTAKRTCSRSLRNGWKWMASIRGA